MRRMPYTSPPLLGVRTIVAEYQEVLEVLPEAVSTDEKGEYALAYGNMAGLLVEAMKEMKSKLDVALARIDTLEKKKFSPVSIPRRKENLPSY